MIVNLNCPECMRNQKYQTFSSEIRFKNDCLYDFKCPDGHAFKANILYHEFQKLFEIGMTSLADAFYREAVGSFAASYERFLELFIRIVLRSRAVSDEIEKAMWKKVSRQSERQLGAFLFIYALEFHSTPGVLPDGLINLRNKTVHQGYFPDRDECIEYGEAILSLIRDAIARLYGSAAHRDELTRSINDQGSEGGAHLHFLAYPLIGTNRPPEEDTKTFRAMLAEAEDVQARRANE